MTAFALAVALLLAGCADMMKLTPQQERTYRAFEECRGQTATYHLTRVNPDGSWTASGDGGGELERLRDCMRRQGYRPN